MGHESVIEYDGEVPVHGFSRIDDKVKKQFGQLAIIHARLHNGSRTIPVVESHEYDDLSFGESSENIRIVPSNVVAMPEPASLPEAQTLNSAS